MLGILFIIIVLFFVFFVPYIETKKNARYRDTIQKEYCVFADKNELENIISSVYDIKFSITYMTNDEAYAYYNNNKDFFLNLQRLLKNNSFIIDISKKYNRGLKEDVERKNSESLKNLKISMNGDNTKDFFETRINGYLGIVKGVEAENKIQELLTKYFPTMQAINSVNIGFGADERYHDFENDVILVGKRGVFTIEVKSKNYKSYTNGYGENKLIIYPDGSTSEKEETDLIKQSSEHANLLEVFLTKKIPHVDFLDVIHEISVITNEDVEIVNQAPDKYNVIKPAGLRATINQYPICLSEENVEQIIWTLEKNKKEPKKYPFLTVKTFQTNKIISEQENFITTLIESGFIKNFSKQQYNNQ